MDKQARPEGRDAPQIAQQSQAANPVRESARREPSFVQGASFLMAGVPMYDIPPEAAAELASKIGNGALCALLADKGFETVSLRMGGAGDVPLNTANASPPTLKEAAGLFAESHLPPCAPGTIVDRASPAAGPNIFDLGGML